jgi:hypothetical protein
MKYTIELDVAGNKMPLVQDFLRAISFVRHVRVVPHNEITNAAILQSIEAYESGMVSPTPLSLSELKEMLNA